MEDKFFIFPFILQQGTNKVRTRNEKAIVFCHPSNSSHHDFPCRCLPRCGSSSTFICCHDLSLHLFEMVETLYTRSMLRNQQVCGKILNSTIVLPSYLIKQPIQNERETCMCRFLSKTSCLFGIGSNHKNQIKRKPELDHNWAISVNTT